MTGKNRPRWLAPAAVTASLALALAACGPEYPNTTFAPLSELAKDIDGIWDVLLTWGLIVFVLVEAALIYVVFRYRHRDDAPEPKHIHGNTAIEILWTVIPAVVLLFIAVPTVRVIFKTQAAAPAGALQIDVHAHQWWWQFTYPEYGITTANELYIPAGRTVSFNLNTNNVLHSFWIPRLAGKRDAVNRRVNKIWFTPDDSSANQVFNGFCAEYCGASHANMHYRVFVLSAADFERWRQHQASPPVLRATPAVVPTGAPGTAVASAAGAAAPATTQTAADSAAAAQSAVYEFPRELLANFAHVIPQTPYPDNVAFPAGMTGDANRGMQLFAASSCMGCHTISGVSPGTVGPNLTHFGSRTTLGAGMYRNEFEALARWIKNSPGMKPGSKMPPQGKGLIDPITGLQGNFDDQQIADIAAYLLSLK